MGLVAGKESRAPVRFQVALTSIALYCIPAKLRGRELAVLAVFKNEKHILCEWLEHYIFEGVDKFFLIDNGSRDKFLKRLRPYVSRGMVSVELLPDRHVQKQIYNSFREDLAEFQWVLPVDLDEFVYGRGQFGRIIDYLRTVDQRVSQLVIPRKLFGSSGLIKQPADVIQSFTKRRQYYVPVIGDMKSVVRSRALLGFGVHRHRVVGVTNDTRSWFDNARGIWDGCDIPARIDRRFHTCVSERILLDSSLALNHYGLQSQENYKRIRVGRGSVAHAWNDNKKTMDHFWRQDETSNAIVDNELARRQQQRDLQWRSWLAKSTAISNNSSRCFPE